MRSRHQGDSWLDDLAGRFSGESKSIIERSIGEKMANEHADGPTTFNLAEADLAGDGKVIDIGPSWKIKKIQVKKNKDGKLELHLSDRS